MKFSSYSFYTTFLPLVIIIFFIWMLSDTFHNETVVKFTGVAKNHRGDILYKEMHQKYYEGNKLTHIKSEFFDADDKPIGEITSDFSQSLELPNYHVMNTRANEEELLKVMDNSVEASFRDAGLKDFSAKTFPIEPHTVSGYGVFETIHDHLDEMSKEEVLHINLIAVPRLSNYPMRISQTTVKGYEDSSKYIGVLFELDVALINLLVPSAEFVFDKQSHNLVYYHGPTNMVTKSGARPTVWVTYTYE